MRALWNPSFSEFTQAVNTEDLLQRDQLPPRSRVLHEVEKRVAGKVFAIFRTSFGSYFSCSLGVCRSDFSTSLVTMVSSGRGVRGALSGQPPEVMRWRLQVAVRFFVCSPPAFGTTSGTSLWLGWPVWATPCPGFDVAGGCPEGRSCPPGTTPAGGQECPHDRRVAKHDHLNNRRLAIVIGSVDRLPFGHRAMEAGDIGRLDGSAGAEP